MEQCIGEGTIDIIVGGASFRSGEPIEGKVVLRLSQPKQARGLRIALIGERELDGQDAGHAGRHTETVFSFPVRLGEEKEYPAGESTYGFSIAVPKLPQQAGVVDLGVFSLSLGGQAIRWRLESSLDAPMSFDINKKLPVTIR